MKYYCVLWMPTTFHKKFVCDPERIGNEPIEISDNTKSHQVTINVDKSENITIKSITYNCEIQLKLLESSYNGLFLYEFDNMEIPEKNTWFIVDEFPCALYHKIKEYYHVHDNHDDDSDALLKAFMCKHEKGRPEIRKPDNEALMHYLKNFEYKFSSYLKLAQIIDRHGVSATASYPTNDGWANQGKFGVSGKDRRS